MITLQWHHIERDGHCWIELIPKLSMSYRLHNDDAFILVPFSYSTICFPIILKKNVVFSLCVLPPRLERIPLPAKSRTWCRLTPRRCRISSSSYTTCGYRPLLSSSVSNIDYREVVMLNSSSSKEALVVVKMTIKRVAGMSISSKHADTRRIIEVI